MPQPSDLTAMPRHTRRVGRWRLDWEHRERLYCNRPEGGLSGEHNVEWPRLWDMIAAILDDYQAALARSLDWRVAPKDWNEAQMAEAREILAKAAREPMPIVVTPNPCTAAQALAARFDAYIRCMDVRDFDTAGKHWAQIAEDLVAWREDLGE